MTDFTIYPRLSKDYILQRVTQEEIFERFIGISVQFDTILLVPSVLRNGIIDNTPTGGFRWSGNKLRFKDFAGYFWGDCFDAVGRVIGRNPNNGEDFAIILHTVARAFKIHKYANIAGSDDIKYAKVEERKKEDEERIIPEKLVYRTMDFNAEHERFWNKLKIIKKEKLIDKYNCNAVLKMWADENLIYEYAKFKTDIAFGYYFGKEHSGIDIVKAYFPNRKKRRFRMNIPTIEGLSLIKGAEVGVITKSYKDVICVNEISELYGYSAEAIALPSETHLLLPNTVDFLRSKYTYLVSLMDFDFTGKNMAWKLNAIYKVPPLFFTDGKYKTTNYGSKDLSEFIERNPLDTTVKLFDKSYNYVIDKYADRAYREGSKT